MERPKKKIRGGDKDVRDNIEHILKNAFGNPIIFDSEPSNTNMKANTFGKYGNNLYIKFSDGNAIKIEGSALS